MDRAKINRIVTENEDKVDAALQESSEQEHSSQ